MLDEPDHNCYCISVLMGEYANVCVYRCMKCMNKNFFYKEISCDGGG